MKKIIFIIIFLLIALQIIYSQSNKKRSFSDAEAYFTDEKYSSALQIYLDLLKNDTLNSNLYYKAGLCYLNNFENRNVRNAITFFNEATQKGTTKNYNESSIKENIAPNDLYYYLGKAYSLINNFDSAIICYNKFKDLLSSKESQLIDLVDRQVITVNNARGIIMNPPKYEAVDFEKYFKFPFYIKDYPILSKDGKTLIYLSPLVAGRKSTDNSSIFYSHYNDTVWSNPLDINSDLKANYNSIPVCLSSDGLKLYFIIDDSDDGNIYCSTFKNGKWLPKEKLNSNINTKYWESYASISTDGKTLYFSSARPGGYGGLDIYKSELNDKGEWGPAINLGLLINSKYDEDMPSISDDNKTLYFSSEGNYSMGGYDLFVSTNLGGNSWSVPQNLGCPVNTVEDDLYSLIKVKGTYLFFPIEKFHSQFAKKSAFKIKESKPSIDTAKFVVQGSITLQDDMNELPKDFKIFVIDTLKLDTICSIKPDLTSGKFYQKIPGGNYKLKFYGSGYNPQTEYIIFPKDNTQKSIVANADMVSNEVSSGKYMAIKNLYFDFDKFIIRKDAEIELEKFIKLMKNDKSLQVEIIGYTGSKGPLKYNKELSDNRVKAVSDYLINNGLNSNRIKTKRGFDNYNAIYENPDKDDNPEKRQFNRRVEIKLIKNKENIVVKNNDIVHDSINYPGYSKNDKYIVLIAKQKNKIDTIKNIIYFESASGDEFIYSSGYFSKMSEANNLLKKVLNMGFTDARIISESEYNKLFNVSNNRENFNVIKNSQLYTIQIMSTTKPVDLSYFKNIDGVKETISENGFHRYTYGTFTSFSKAKEALKSLSTKRFPHAFIIKLSNSEKNH